MNHRKSFNRLNRSSAHRRAMIRNMATVLFKHERITTTKAKALEVRKHAERMITRAKIDNVHNRRLVGEKIKDQAVLAKLFLDIGPRMNERNGGYTRILKIGTRKGDAASLVILELVDYKLDGDKSDKKKSADKAKKTRSDAKKASGREKAKGKTRATAKAAKPKEEATTAEQGE